jgi:hypothetical protein
MQTHYLNIYQFKCDLKLLLPPYNTVGAAAIFINSSVALKFYYHRITQSARRAAAPSMLVLFIQGHLP